MLCGNRKTGQSRGVNRITIALPWPDKALWQNTKPHWSIIAAATKAARLYAWTATLEHGGRHMAFTGRPRLVWTFHPPPRSTADLPNAIAAMKPSIDGIQDAIQIDDRHFLNAFPEEFGESVKGGKVIVTIEDSVTCE